MKDIYSVDNILQNLNNELELEPWWDINGFINKLGIYIKRRK